jgi:hypothetical protein
MYLQWPKTDKTANGANHRKFLRLAAIHRKSASPPRLRTRTVEYSRPRSPYRPPLRPCQHQYPAASSRSPYASYSAFRTPHSAIEESNFTPRKSKPVQASPTCIFHANGAGLIGSESLLTAMNGYERVRTAPNSDYDERAVLNTQSFQLLIALQFTKQFRNGFGLIRQNQIGRDLGQRLQHKPPLMRAQMR